MNSAEVPVEIVEWTPRWGLGGLAANFARTQILLTMFDGDPEKWLEMIERNGGADDEGDLLFLQEMRDRLSVDPTLLDDLRRIVNDFAVRFGTAQSDL